MISKIVWAIKLYLNPPKTGDVFLGDPFDFIFGHYLEQVFHGTRDKFGDPLWEPIPSHGCYRLTITSDVMPYYIFDAEVACKHISGDKTEWKKRSQPRRIWKKVFHQMIAEGMVKKDE